MQSRVRRNTERILDAATVVLANEGWAEFTLAGVAREAGLSEQAVRTRAATRADLAALLWRERLGAEVTELISDCVAGVRAATADGIAKPLIDALQGLVVRTPERDAVVELLLLSHYVEPVAESVDAALREDLHRWTTPSPSLSREDAARTAFAIAMALGLLLTNHYPRARNRGMRAALTTRARALQQDTAVGDLPSMDASHMDEPVELAEDDPALDRLLNAALEAIALRGFDQVPVTEIAATAGYTEGLVFRRYPSKLDMLIDATGRQAAAGWQANNDFSTALSAEHGDGVAEAVFLREAQRPGREVGRQMALELLRLSRHDARLYHRAVGEMDAFRASLLEQPGWDRFETEADFHLNVAVPFGAYLLPRFVPESWLLPYHVVTVPLYDLFEEQRVG